MFLTAAWPEDSNISSAIDPIDHFDIYLGENFEKTVSDHLDFFKKHLTR
jgi:hypothetical protein